MFCERDVTGIRWSRGAGVAVATGAPPADAPPVLAASALVAQNATRIKLQKTAKTERDRKTTTSFVGLRG
jgi:hypothetical protein